MNIQSIPQQPDVLRWITMANAAGLLVLASWVVSISYSAGERARQMDVNTSRISSLEINGSLGTRARLDGIERRLMEMQATQERIQSTLDQILMQNVR